MLWRIARAVGCVVEIRVHPSEPVPRKATRPKKTAAMT
jgi:hypothetical protein